MPGGPAPSGHTNLLDVMRPLCIIVTQAEPKKMIPATHVAGRRANEPWRTQSRSS